MTAVVSEADRVAAAKLLLGHLVGGSDGGTYIVNTPTLAQAYEAFARHAASARAEALEDAAVMADQYCQRMARLVGESAGDDGEAADAAYHANHIATAIRALSGHGEGR